MTVEIRYLRSERDFNHNRNVVNIAAPSRKNRSDFSPYFLFILLALYGPSVNIIGEFRYVEIVILLILTLNIPWVMHHIGRWEKIFAGLFLLTAFMHVVSDLVNDASIEGTLKRTATYVLLASLVIATQFLTKREPKRVRWLLAGYCFSYITVLVVGQSASKNYADDPWRLGLGSAMTVAIALVPLWHRPLLIFTGPTLMLMGVLHLFLLARGLALVCFVAGLASLGAQFFGKRVPSQFRPRSLAIALVAIIMSAIIVSEGARWATKEHLFPTEVQAKMELQVNNPYGLAAAARPDTYAAIQGVMISPWLGFGSTNADPEVMAIYRDINAHVYEGQTGYFEALKREKAKTWELGTPSHSHLLGAWVDAGAFAAGSWIVLFGFALYILWRSLKWRNAHSPLFILISMLAMQDTLISPGPIRMDVAIRLMVLIYAAGMFRRFDRERKLRSRALN